jgi:chromosome segregation ATPase
LLREIESRSHLSEPHQDLGVQQPMEDYEDRIDDLKRQHEQEIAEIREQNRRRLLEDDAARELWDRERTALSESLEQLRREAELLRRACRPEGKETEGPQSEPQRLQRDFAEDREEFREHIQKEQQEQFIQAERRFETEVERCRNAEESLRAELNSVQQRLAEALQEIEHGRTRRGGDPQASKQMQIALLRFEQERQTLQNEVEHFRKETEALKQWRESTRKDMAALWSERDALLACRDEFEKRRKEIQVSSSQSGVAVQQAQEQRAIAPARSGFQMIGTLLAVCVASLCAGAAGGIVFMLMR